MRPDIYLARMMSDWNPENWLFVLWIEGVIIESLLIKKSNNEKYDFGKSSIIFIFQDLTAIKEAIAFNCRKLKGTFILQSYYNRNGMINVKRECLPFWPIKTLHTKKSLTLMLGKSILTYLKILISLCIFQFQDNGMNLQLP